MLTKKDIEDTTIQDIIDFDFKEWNDNMNGALVQEDRNMLAFDWYDNEECFKIIKKYFIHKCKEVKK